jgi:hypothetical protein
MSERGPNDRLDRILAEEIRAEYGSEAVPREEMWREVAAARADSRRRSVRTRYWAVAALVAAAIAALVVLGRDPAPGPQPPAPTQLATPAIDPDDLLLRGHFARTGRLLDAVADSVPAHAAGDARPLLAATRALLDAPGGQPATEQLLEDAEVALALLVRAGTSPAPVERQVLRATLAEARIADRLRAAGAGGG